RGPSRAVTPADGVWAAPGGGGPDAVRIELFGPGHIGRTRRGAAVRREEWLTPLRAATVRRPSADVYPAPDPVSLERRAASHALLPAN
ncbi:hypothetical protein ACFRH6_30530, partial [Streptomyces sp. NPDC056749]|uniref:hypothetical protein n=1 Tax=Streptomyces sp. NPDC056749 TaxID=3345936 RepID=UPI003680B2BA